MKKLFLLFWGLSLSNLFGPLFATDPIPPIATDSTIPSFLVTESFEVGLIIISVYRVIPLDFNVAKYVDYVVRDSFRVCTHGPYSRCKIAGCDWLENDFSRAVLGFSQRIKKISISPSEQIAFCVAAHVKEALILDIWSQGVDRLLFPEDPALQEMRSKMVSFDQFLQPGDHDHFVLPPYEKLLNCLRAARAWRKLLRLIHEDLWEKKIKISDGALGGYQQKIEDTARAMQYFLRQ